MADAIATPTLFTAKQAAVSAAPAREEGAAFSGSLAAGLVLAVLAVVGFVLSRRRHRAVRRLEVLESLSLGPKRSLCLARVDDRTLVLGVSEAGVQLLASHETRSAPATLTSPTRQEPSSFGALLEESTAEQELRERLQAGGVTP